MQILAQLATGEVVKRKPALVLGPGVWKQLKRDATLARLGLPMTAVVPDGKKARSFEARSYSKAHDLDAAAKLASFRALGDAFREGRARPADERERHLFYVGISFEIENDPVTIVSRGNRRLLVYVSEGKDGALVWLEDLGAWEALLRGGDD